MAVCRLCNYQVFSSNIPTETSKHPGRNEQGIYREDILKGFMDCKPEGRRRIERPKHRGIDGVLEDVKELGVKNWWTVARDREAEARTGL